MVKNIEISELIVMLEEFFEGEKETIFDVGEMVGCNLLRYAAEAAVKYVQFNNILFVSGSPDPAYASERKNFVFWKWLFFDFIIDGVRDVKPTLDAPTFKYNRQEYEPRLIPSTIHDYSVIIINQAQLIPKSYMDMLTESFSGQIVRIYDPFDILGEYVDVPLRCLDTFEKLPLTLGYARSLYGIETRNINKRAKNTLSFGSIKRRSIGRIDESQFVTRDYDLRSECNDRQMSVPFRKNQKVINVDNRLNIVKDSIYQHVHSLGWGTLLHISYVNEDYVRCRIHSSRAEFNEHLSYEFKPFITSPDTLIVKPANVIDTGTILNMYYFKQIIYVVTKEEPVLSVREQYTLLKQSQNLIIAKTK